MLRTNISLALPLSCVPNDLSDYICTFSIIMKFVIAIYRFQQKRNGMRILNLNLTESHLATNTSKDLGLKFNHKIILYVSTN